MMAYTFGQIKMKTVFYAILSDDFRDSIIDYTGFYRSFKCFHPDIDLVTFGTTEIQKLFNEKPWLNYCNCKASFAKLLYNDYDLVVNVDADFYFFDRCIEILEGDYDVAAAANFNELQNVSILPRVVKGVQIPEVSLIQYIQGGLIASTSKKFWDEYEETSKYLADSLPLMENDVLNILWYSKNDYKLKVLDGDLDFRSPNFKQYYNCASLARERQIIVQNDRLLLDNKPVRSYHVARGNAGRRPKERPHQLFSPDVVRWFNQKVGK